MRMGVYRVGIHYIPLVGKHERERERESMCVCLPIGARKKIFCKTEIVRAGIGRE